jgi:hypothetical protein
VEVSLGEVPFRCSPLRRPSYYNNDNNADNDQADYHAHDQGPDTRLEIKVDGAVIPFLIGKQETLRRTSSSMQGKAGRVHAKCTQPMPAVWL